MGLRLAIQGRLATAEGALAGDASDRRLLSYSFRHRAPAPRRFPRASRALRSSALGDPAFHDAWVASAGRFRPARGANLPDYRWSKTTVPLTLLSLSHLDEKARDRFRRGPREEPRHGRSEVSSIDGKVARPRGVVSDSERRPSHDRARGLATSIRSTTPFVHVFRESSQREDSLSRRCELDGFTDPAPFRHPSLVARGAPPKQQLRALLLPSLADGMIPTH